MSIIVNLSKFSVDCPLASESNLKNSSSSIGPLATPKIEKVEDIADESSFDAFSNLEPPKKRSASPEETKDPAKINQADQQMAMLSQFRMGYRECMSETMHFLVESEGFFAADSFCVRLMGHLQKYCDAFTSENTPPSGTVKNLTLHSLFLVYFGQDYFIGSS